MNPKAVRKYAKELALNAIKDQKADFKNWAIIGDWDHPYKTMVNSKISIPESSNVYYLIWTTTPWTLVANRAIAVNPDLDYTIIRADDNDGSSAYYIVAANLAHQISNFFPGSSTIFTETSIKGSEFVGNTYYQFFDKKEYPILPAEYVTSMSGTGLVHTAPGHGKEDFELCSSYGISPYSPVDDLGGKRLEAFVKGRSQWCISRQRPWGTPIPVFYDSITDEPLMTEKSVDYVISKFKESGGSDAWWNLSTEDLLAPEYKNNGKTYIKKYDTLDVWFDSGTSWTLIADMIPNDDKKFVADVYLEGSDQHRGWFQSSLITSCLVNGISPYKTLFTHGFFLDEQGSKMSKSLGNVMYPSDIIEGVKSDSTNYPGYGVDVLRLWVGMHDTSSDVNVGPQILSNVSTVMRKIRGTFRFLLASLNDFSVEKILPTSSLQQVDIYVLGELSKTIKSIQESFDNYAFYRGMQSLNIFINTTLSSFYIDVIKDRLYADKTDSVSRLSAQTTCHHEDSWDNPEISKNFELVRQSRSIVNNSIEQLRKLKSIGSSLETKVDVYISKESEFQKYISGNDGLSLSDIYIVSRVTVFDISDFNADILNSDVIQIAKSHLVCSDGTKDDFISVAKKSDKHKCPRCWKYTSDSVGSLCSRCEPIVKSIIV
ncbi:Isoleucine-tRNA ligase [Smittium mucronatum]|uniref:Isoleucine-tRNA ligase n=1 Tax=Smittium mucronatum TaxID=133383 RepID=A0A1R0H7F1_9FUNG|nr:Isoleucine-tRNA ligase [Smittium mucronatum]